MTLLLIFLGYAIALSIGLARAGYRTRTAPSAAAPLEHAKRILIVGATGGMGRQLVAQALGRGYDVIALVRDPSRLMSLNGQKRTLMVDNERVHPSGVTRAWARIVYERFPGERATVSHHRYSCCRRNAMAR